MIEACSGPVAAESVGRGSGTRGIVNPNEMRSSSNAPDVRLESAASGRRWWLDVAPKRVRIRAHLVSYGRTRYLNSLLGASGTQGFRRRLVVERTLRGEHPKEGPHGIALLERGERLRQALENTGVGCRIELPRRKLELVTFLHREKLAGLTTGVKRLTRVERQKISNILSAHALGQRLASLVKDAHQSIHYELDALFQREGTLQKPTQLLRAIGRVLSRRFNGRSQSVKQRVALLLAERGSERVVHVLPLVGCGQFFLPLEHDADLSCHFFSLVTTLDYIVGNLVKLQSPGRRRPRTIGKIPH